MSNEVQMVRADAIVHTGLATISKATKVAALAKETGEKSAIIKARHFAQQGAALALAATVTGKGTKTAATVYAQAELQAIVNKHGVIDNARAVATVVAVLQEPYTYEEAIRADGQRVVKRATWLALREHLAQGLQAPTPQQAKGAKRYSAALQVWDSIQARADALRSVNSAAQALAAPAAQVAAEPAKAEPAMF